MQFFGGSSKHDDVGTRRRPDVAFRRRADVGPTPRRIGPTSARCRADEQTTSIRRRADVNYRYVADVVLTSARRRRVYWEEVFCLPILLNPGVGKLKTKVGKLKTISAFGDEHFLKMFAHLGLKACRRLDCV